MKTRKIPLRKCIACNESKSKKELIRGAYICKDPDCFNKVKKSRGLNRTLQMEIPDEIYDELLKEITDAE